jgi:hypothetical protein
MNKRRSSRPAALASLAAAVLLVLILGVMASRSPAKRVPPPPKSALEAVPGIQGPHFDPATVAGPTGEKITCPFGSEPYVNISNAFFTPPLQGGTTFLRRTYQVRLTGTVVNETTNPIVIKGLAPFVGADAWKGTSITAPSLLSANSSGKLAITGKITIASARKASVSAKLSWQWAQTALAPCGAIGLVEDD